MSLAACAAAAPSASDEIVQVRNLQSAGRWAAAESLATLAIARLQSTPAPDSLAMATLMAEIVRGRTIQGAVRDSGAIPMARRVLGIRVRALGPRDSEVASAHYALAYLFGPAGLLDSAFVHATRALEIRRAVLAPDDTLIAESLRLLGLVERDQSDFRSAAGHFGEAFAVRLRSHGEDRPAMALLLAEQGNALRRLRALDEARAVLERSIDIYTRLGGEDFFFRTIPLDYLANVERDAGNLGRSIDLSQEALRVARVSYPEDNQYVVRLRRNMSGTLTVFGDHRGAQSLLERVVPSYVKAYGPEHPRTLSARMSLGIARVGVGDSVGAMSELRAVEAGFTALPGAPDAALATAVMWQGQLLASCGDHASARSTWQRAIPIARRVRAPQWLTLAELQIGLVHSMVALGDTAGLEFERLELLRIASQDAANTSNIRQTLALANSQALNALGRTDEAWSEALNADRISYQRLQANARGLPDRRALQLSLTDSPTRDFVLELARAGSDDRIETAWDAVVRSRGLVRNEVARRRLSLDVRGDTALVAVHGRWVSAQRDYARQLVESADGSDSTAADRLDPLRAAAEHAERDLARALGTNRTISRRPDARLADARTHLAPGSALVSFVETEAATDTARVTALIALGGSEHIARVELGRSAQLRARILPWRERLAVSPGPAARANEAAERECRRRGQEVRAAIWDPITPHLGGAQTVFVVPDGPLFSLPWHGLPDGSSAYLVERGPTLRLLNAERDLSDPPLTMHSGELLAVGAPNFGDRGADAPALPAELFRSSSGPCAGGLPVLLPLPGTAAEVQAIARTWTPHAEILTGSDATEQAFKREAPGCEVIHLATHGLMARDTCMAGSIGLRGVGGVEALDDPARSDRTEVPKAGASKPPPPASPWLARRVWLALAGANRASEHADDENEGLLTAEEVLTLDLSDVDWVVLSACHSGAAEDWSREGALGMRRAFHLAGARTVIASQWAVEDQATSEWMQALYTARASGAAYAGLAMAWASRSVLERRRAAGRSTHPFYWAAFDATGE